MTYRIDADHLIVGDGELITNGSVVVDGKKISYAGEDEHAPDVEDTQHVNTLMPGLWECHGHYVGVKSLDLNAEWFTDHMVHGMRTVNDARRTLYSGVTSVREAGGYGVFLKKVIEEGTVPGPRVYGAGAAMSMTGGHADLHAIPWEIMCSQGRSEQQWFLQVDGVAECLKGVRRQLRKGAEIIKIMGSGGVLSEIDHPIHQQFSYEEARAIVEEAARAETAVMSHCHGGPGIKNSLEVGVKTIEHGSYLDEDLADLMIEKDAILVPTRLIIDETMQAFEKMNVPEFAKRKMIETADRHWEAMKIAIDKGVTIAMGTDIAGSGALAPIVRWGTNPKELQYYVDAGMSPMDAIVTGTGNGPKTLGPRAPKSGMLKTGYDADILLLKKNPLDNIKFIQDQDNIEKVIREGKLY
jgi:imidazolonepropionase-like amidohydrolase